jgi:hypothetical protein
VKRENEIRQRVVAQKFRTRNEEFVGELKSLLGSRSNPLSTADAEEASRLAKEFKAGYESAVPHDWALVKVVWGDAKTPDLVDALNKLSNHLGNREVWLLDLREERQAVALDSEEVLDNPVGFAAVCDQQVALLDRDVPGGFWLVRHSYHVGRAITYEWELEIWGEPWLSAATRTLRDV